VELPATWREGLTQKPWRSPELPFLSMATRNRLLALGRQLRASAPLVGQGVPVVSSGANLPPMAFAAVDAVECAPRARRCRRGLGAPR
jgi:hypothetical protein